MLVGINLMMCCNLKPVWNDHPLGKKWTFERGGLSTQVQFAWIPFFTIGKLVFPDGVALDRFYCIVMNGYQNFNIHCLIHENH